MLRSEPMRKKCFESNGKSDIQRMEKHLNLRKGMGLLFCKTNKESVLTLM